MARHNNMRNSFPQNKLVAGGQLWKSGHRCATSRRLRQSEYGCWNARLDCRPVHKSVPAV